MKSLGLGIGIVLAAGVLVGCGAEGRRTATEPSADPTVVATTVTVEPPTTPVTPTTTAAPATTTTSVARTTRPLEGSDDDDSQAGTRTRDPGGDGHGR